MIESKPELTIAKDSLWSLSLSRQKGDRISFEDIEAATGIERYAGSWLHVVKSWKERMSRERGIVVFARGGKSSGQYDLLTDRQVTTEYSEFQQRCSRRRIRRTLKRVRRTDDQHLTLHERRIKLELIAGLRRESAQITAGLKIGKIRKTQTNPQRRLKASA